MPRKKSAQHAPPEEPPQPRRRGRPKKPAAPHATEPDPADRAPACEPPPTEAEPVEPFETQFDATEPVATDPAPDAVAVSDDEAALAAKYGATHRIVPGSLRYAGGREGWGHKRTVEVRCRACPAARVVATSDLQWATTGFCHGCAAAERRGRRAETRAKRPTTRTGGTP